MKGSDLTRRGGATAVLAIAVAALAGGVAYAAPVGCATGNLCLWEDAGYETNGVQTDEAWFSTKYSDFRYREYKPGMNAHNNASSIFNNGTIYGVYMYTNVNYGGSSFYLPKNTGDGNLSTGTSPVPLGFNDELDSGCFTSYC